MGFAGDEEAREHVPQGRHGVDRPFDALAGPEEAPGEDERPCVDGVTRAEVPVVDGSVGDHRDAGRVDAVVRHKPAPRRLGHRHDDV